ncbi:MAG: hypothetical protein AAB425_08000, partial [Bdellovibrionota bacterium]
ATSVTASSNYAVIKACDPYGGDHLASCPPDPNPSHLPCYEEDGGQNQNKCNSSHSTTARSKPYIPACLDSDPASATYQSCFSGKEFINIATSKPIPIKSSSKMRLYYEADDHKTVSYTDASGVYHIGGGTRIFSMDSQDGFTGDDWNPGTDTGCGEKYSTSSSSSTEYWHDIDFEPYHSTGRCAPEIVMGLDWDPEGYGNGHGNGISKANQFDIGFRKLEDWRWTEADGTPMIFGGTAVTTRLKSGSTSEYCFPDADGLTGGLFQAYYKKSTGKWVVVNDNRDCPKLFTSGHEPVIVHTGGVSGNYTFKLYYTHADSGATYERERLIYASTGQSGSGNKLDYDDWEDPSGARYIHYLWPNGDVLPDCEMDSMGDSYMHYPDPADKTIQYMNMNLGGCTDSSDSTVNQKTNSGIAFAKLVNP